MQRVGKRTGINRTHSPCDITCSLSRVFHCEADWKMAKVAGKVVRVLSEVLRRDDIGGSGSEASGIVYVSTRLG